ncbi:MAG: Rrf2 family transcriptional regulator [Bacteroidota bacterium]|nr:Rrf2 family transcriptional regulator [Bacteroidota bacterium]
MLYSKTARYSIQSMMFIAANNTGKNILVRDVAVSLGLPPSFLSKILQTLSRYGFLNSVKGPHGGFSLSDKGAAATLLQIIEIIDGPMDFDMCIMGSTACDEKNPCPLHNPWKRIREDIRLLLSKRTILKLATEMSDKYKPILLAGDMPAAAKRKKTGKTTTAPSKAPMRSKSGGKSKRR